MFGGPSIPLFRVLGFRVGAHWSFFLALGVAGFSRGGLSGVLLSSLLFLSVLLHELGHAVVARRRGVPILGIDLHFFGGVAKMGSPPRSPNDEVAIAAAGPIVSLLLALGFFALASRVKLPVVGPLLGWLAAANLALGLFNLLPALPLDGGRVFRALLAKRTGLYRGTRYAIVANRFFAVALGVLGLWSNPWLVAMAVLVWSMGSAELRAIEHHATLMELRGWYPVDTPWASYDDAARTDRTSGSTSNSTSDGQGRKAVEPEILKPQPRW
jgi:Zn-dependent protease